MAKRKDLAIHLGGRRFSLPFVKLELVELCLTNLFSYLRLDLGLSALRNSGACGVCAKEISRFWAGKVLGPNTKVLFPLHICNTFTLVITDIDEMSTESANTNGTTPGERHVIGISFGNSNSSIAYATIEDKAEVIANEDGGLSLGKNVHYLSTC